MKLARLAAVLTLALACRAWGQTATEPPAASVAQGRVVAMEVTVNGTKVGSWPLVEQKGLLYASEEALDDWRLKVRPTAESIKVNNAVYWPLVAIKGFSAKVNYLDQSVELTFSPDAFSSTQVGQASSERHPISPVLPSAYASYDLNFDSTRSRGAPATNNLGALFEVGASNSIGLIRSTFAAQNLLGGPLTPPKLTRLETTFTRDFPENNYTLSVGDSATRQGLWGTTSYFGGVRFGTNFALTPNFFTQPIPVISGVSSSPSTVQLYVNNVLRQTTQVPTGPFVLGNTAAFTGGGEARLVVTDILGRQVVTTQPFFSSPGLLRAGLDDFSVEAGLLRMDFGQASFHYAHPFASGIFRRGMSDTFTLEGRAEVSREQQAAGGGAVIQVGQSVLGRSAVAFSHSEAAGTGARMMLGADKLWTTGSLSAQVEASTRGFRSLGQHSSAGGLRTSWAANMSGATPFGSLGFGIASITSWDPNVPRLTTLSGNYSYSIGANMTLTAYLSKSIGAANGIAGGVTVVMPLGGNTFANSAVNVQGHNVDVYASATKSPAIVGDWGWRVLGGRAGGQVHAEGGLSYMGRYGDFQSDLSVSPNLSQLRLRVAGGLVMAENSLFATPPLTQSYAVIEAKDLQNVGVGYQGNYAARIGSNGLALLTNLSPWVANEVQLNPEDLPVTADIESISQVVVPPLRRAVKITFVRRSGRAALIRIELDDGEPAPAGAQVRVDGQKEQFWVARRGEAYVTGLESSNKVEMTWENQSCTFTVEVPEAGKDDINRIGPFTCSGVKR